MTDIGLISEDKERARKPIRASKPIRAKGGNQQSNREESRTKYKYINT